LQQANLTKHFIHKAFLAEYSFLKKTPHGDGQAEQPHFIASPWLFSLGFGIFAYV